ncbi:MAG: DUF1571 domain-containing protein [Fimbriiglobus sp.]|nr:DUF1571 domain-containing protein [Fimbriiglobus sp.]
MTHGSLSALALSLSAGLVVAADPPRPTDPVKPVAATEVVPVSARIEIVEAGIKGEQAWAKAFADAKTAYSKTRDYSGYMVRQERVGGKLLAEQTCEIRVRTEPFAIYSLTLAPKGLFNQELAYMSGKKDDKVRAKMAGVAGAGGFVTVSADDAKANAESRYTITNTGIGAVLKRIETALDAERVVKNTPQVVASEYKFNDRPCMRYEIFCERAHAKRFAARMVVYIDNEYKLPVRFEAYDAPKVGEKAGELTECVSFVKLVFNAGLGDAVFDK